MPAATLDSSFPAPRRSNDSISAATSTTFSSAVLVNGNPNGAAWDTNGPILFTELDGQDVSHQLEVLNNWLGFAVRIKDGAENMLKVQTKENFKAKLATELDTAKTRIEAISQRIEMLSARPIRKDTSGSPVNGKRKLPSLGSSSSPRMKEASLDKEEVRATAQVVAGLLKTLVSYSTSVISPVATSPSSSSATHPQNDADRDRTRTDIMTKLVQSLQRSPRVRNELHMDEIVDAAFPSLADRYSKECRTAAYRLLRYAMTDLVSIKYLQGKGVDWFIVKTLARDNKHAMEKEQAVKLVRTIVEVGSERSAPHAAAGTGTVPLSEIVMRAFVAVAEHADDPFRLICLLTLCEILMIDIDLMTRTGGMRVLLHSLSDGITTEGGPATLAMLFLFLADAPGTRVYLHPGTDIEVALAGITDAYGKGTDHAGRMRTCARVVTAMLRSFSGLIYLCMDDMRAIRAIIDTLRIPSLETREVVLDMFFDLLNIKTPEWFQTFIDGRRLTMYRRSRHEPNPKKEPEPPPKAPDSLKLTDQYIALLLLVLTDAGIMDALTCMIEESTTGSNLSRKATLLMGEVLQLANKVLPLSMAAKIQAVPRVFSLAADYGRNDHRIVGTSALSAFDSFNRNRARLQRTPIKDSRQRSNSIEDPVRRGQRQVEQVKIKMGMQMDDKSFNTSLLETQVTLTKDYTKWSFDTLQDLIEGPFQNPKRLEEVIKVSTRFIRRLMSFFHPFSHRFSDIKRTKSNHRWVKLGCSLLTTLISNPDGQRFLSSEDDFLKQIVKSFAQLDPFNSTYESDPIFSKVRVEGTLTYGYFEMLGTLSKSKEGVELMEKFKVFTAFYHLSELRSREDLIKGIIENIDYTIDGHPRIVLSKALTSSYKHIRLYATNHLGQLICCSVKANAWTLRLLLTQLYDPALEVAEMAVHFLEEACESLEILQLVVEMQPTLDHLGEIGHPLLLKFMSTPMGFRYLVQADYIDREMNMWFHERNLDYVVQIEIYLSKSLGMYHQVEDDDDITFDGMVPPHFYGEMAKTQLGCQILQDRGHFTEFADFLRQRGLESEDPDQISRLKSILWAVGNIGASEGGILFLEEEEIIPVILEIAEQSLVLSVRGTCFFVLGLVSSTTQGAEILVDYGWEATLSPLGSPTGLCVPLDVAKFVSIPPWDPISSRDEIDGSLKPPANQQEEDVMTAIFNLANSVIANQASRTLARLKSRPETRHVFSSRSLYYRALHAISTQRYRLPVRRYIIDLFDIELDSDVVRALSDYARQLAVAAPTAAKPTRVVSIVGRQPRGRWTSESDDEDMDSGEEEQMVVDEQPVINLRPKSTIYGFDGL